MTEPVRVPTAVALLKRTTFFYYFLTAPWTDCDSHAPATKEETVGRSGILIRRSSPSGPTSPTVHRSGSGHRIIGAFTGDKLSSSAGGMPYIKVRIFFLFRSLSYDRVGFRPRDVALLLPRHTQTTD